MSCCRGSRAFCKSVEAFPVRHHLQSMNLPLIFRHSGKLDDPTSLPFRIRVRYTPMGIQIQTSEYWKQPPCARR